MRPTSIRVRLTAWYGALLMATLVGLGAAVYVLLERSLVRRVDAMLDFEFKEAAERLASGRTARVLHDAPAAFHETYLVRITTRDLHVLVQSPALEGRRLPVPRVGEVGRPSSHQSVLLGELGPCRLATGAARSRHGPRIVQIATPLEPHDKELAALRDVLWTILPAGTLVTVVGGYWLAGRALAPVGRMTEAARRISAANLDERIATTHAGDELSRLGETLNAMLDRIDRAFVATRRFTSDAAHELKTPLSSIRTEAEVALLVPRSPEEYQRTLQSVVEEAARLSRLADLLLLSSEHHDPGLSRGRVRLDEAVSASVQRAAVATRGKIEIRLDEPPPLEVEGEYDLLRQVFDNLLDNAVKYSADGGRVSVSGRRDGGQAVVEVADQGIGVPPDALPRIFDRFYRVDASRSRRTGGTGLGLSIAKAVVERHGGTIEAASEPGRGSTFRVRLPLAPEEPPATSRAAERSFENG